RAPLGARAGLERWHADRRIPLHLRGELAAPGGSAGGGGGAERRLGDRRPRGPGRGARAASPSGRPAGLAQPAPREPRVRAVDAGHAGGASAPGRVRARQRPAQPRAARATPEPLMAETERVERPSLALAPDPRVARRSRDPSPAPS